ncbi:DUF6115 domain-containing protein [Mesobacillus maritimus]|uniref:DUF6115 domain-containing protein n=1 Tax=Mesobacillus maritimus TaxID=1643336 RepID=UPI00384DBD97
MDWISVSIGLSILLNILSLLMLIQSKKRNDSDTEKDVQTIQQSVEHFILKIETENDNLYQKIVHYVKTNQHGADGRIPILEEKIRLLEEKLEFEGPSDDQKGELPPHASLPSNQIQDEESVQQLFKQGFSPRQIAKVLQMEDGEVELIINLLKKRQILPR